MADTNIDAGPIIIGTKPYGVFSHYPPSDRDYTLDNFIDIENDPIEITILPNGEQFNVSIYGPIVPLSVSLTGGWVDGIAIDAGPIELTITPRFNYFITEQFKNNWVAWSRIGRPDWTIGLDNVAGERPMEWSGFVHDIKKLGSSVAVYGANGVSILTPNANVWGMETIHPLGIVNKGASCGNKDMHFFIDTQYKLYKLSNEGLKLLDYSEYLSQLGTIIMSFDMESNLIYICDGVKGYVYSILSESFGEGPETISGIGSKDGELYIVSPEAVEMPKLDICTDIYDLGTRSPKTIKEIEIGTDLTEHLEVMVETRISNRDAFRQSKWALVNPDGVAHIPCYGVEFKFHVRSYIYEAMEIDYIKVNGVLHGFNYLNSTGVQ